MRVSRQTLEKIKSVSISDVIARDGSHLKKVGREFVTHCVWHDDKNPSLTISDDKGFLFCHVCREGGDIISYFQHKYGLAFSEACERVAAISGIQVEYDDDNSPESIKRRQEYDRMLEGVKKRQETYRASLREPRNRRVIDFIIKRGIAAETSKYFGLGFDARENRLTIPIQDHRGRIVGFTGGALGDAKPKYKNTENNLVFNKSDIVFNEYNSLKGIREAGECVFVEGHIDVIAMHQAGIPNCVALQGTATPELSVLKRLAKRTQNFVLCMDSDAGGEAAIGLFLEKAQALALKSEVNIKIASIPQGKDPDEAISLGVDMKKVIANAIPWIDWILDKWLKTLDFSDTTKVGQVEHLIKDLISKIESTALRAHYFDKAATRLAQNKQELAVEIFKNLQKGSSKSSPAHKTWLRPGLFWTRTKAERSLIRLYIHAPLLRPYCAPLMAKLITPEIKWLWERVLELEQYCDKDFTPHEIMAILAISDPNYVEKLRPLASPTIKLVDTPEVLAHIEDVMLAELETNEQGILT